MKEQIKSCGVVVYTLVNNEIHYILVQSKLHGHYGFTKGHCEANESDEETALREVKEEIGIEPNILEGFKTQTSYLIPSGQIKNVVYFLGSVLEPTIVIQDDEISNYKILPFEEAYNLLSYDHDKDILKLSDNYLKVNV